MGTQSGLERNDEKAGEYLMIGIMISTIGKVLIRYCFIKAAIFL